jgi:hypothetical protein
MCTYGMPHLAVHSTCYNESWKRYASELCIICKPVLTFQIMARALRVRKLKDIFQGVRHILQTLTHDPETKRVRSIKPDEKVTSMWDNIGKTAKAWTVNPSVSSEVTEIDTPIYGYTDADEIEDALLFPHEASGEMKDNLFGDNPSAMDDFENGFFNPDAFAEDLDTDEESMDSYDDFDSEDEDIGSDIDIEALAAQLGLPPKSDGPMEPNDEDGSEWTDSEMDAEDDGDMPNWKKYKKALLSGQAFITKQEQEDTDKACEVLLNQLKRSGSREPDYFIPILRDPEQAKKLPSSVTRDPANLMEALRSALCGMKEYGMSEMAMEADFLRHLDRQKAKGMESKGYT